VTGSPSLFAADPPAAATDARGGLPDAGRQAGRRRQAASQVHTLETNVGQGKAQNVPEWKRDGFITAAAAREFDKRMRQQFGAMADGLMPLTLPTPGERAWRHGWWQEQRDELRAALVRTATPAKVLERWDCCGSDCWVMVHKKTGDVRLSSNTCRNRWCLPCAISRANLIAGNLADELRRRRFQRFSHIVLTLASRPVPLRKQITRLYKCFRKLRDQRPAWFTRRERFKSRKKKPTWWGWHVGGFAAFLEVTLNDDAGSRSCGLWHVHLHIIGQARFVPHDELSSLWNRVTGDSCVVDVREIKDVDGAAAEVSKYASKSVSELDGAIARDPNKLDELIRAYAGRRLCFTGGSWRGLNLAEKPAFDPSEWWQFGRLDDAKSRADNGDDRALVILAILRGEKRGLQLPPPLPGAPIPSEN
jgi:hypothetical protein